MYTLKKWGLLTFFIVLVCPTVSLFANETSREEKLKKESIAVLERSQKIAAQFYTLNTDEDIKEITQDILSSAETNECIKQIIKTTGRRFFIFIYPSDGLKIKGCISFVPDPTQNHLLIFLRGGNRMLGLMHPATDFSCIRNYTVLSTTYRGGVSEGADEFGGSDVNDVPNLLNYIPVLQQKLNINFNPEKVFLLGGSRGGMEMFLALTRFTALQKQIHKAASLSGLLDINECMRFREDMKNMFSRDFGLIEGINDKEWTTKRNPIDNIATLRRDLPILIVQGTNDIRVSLNEGQTMVERLRENGNSVSYLEIKDGDHCLSNVPNRMELIADWFES